MNLNHLGGRNLISVTAVAELRTLCTASAKWAGLQPARRNRALRTATTIGLIHCARPKSKRAARPRATEPGHQKRNRPAHYVRVVNGRLVVPDLQIEYENAEGQLARVNLELATKHYRPGQLEVKARAGFTLYADTQDADRLRRILNDREITAKILSL